MQGDTVLDELIIENDFLSCLAELFIGFCGFEVEEEGVSPGVSSLDNDF